MFSIKCKCILSGKTYQKSLMMNKESSGIEKQNFFRGYEAVNKG